jgi:hypothetical protein
MPLQYGGLFEGSFRRNLGTPPKPTKTGPPEIGHEPCTILTVRCHFLATVLACDAVAGWGARDGEPQMRSILTELFLFSCVGALFVGVVLTAANLVG